MEPRAPAVSGGSGSPQRPAATCIRSSIEEEQLRRSVAESSVAHECALTEDLEHEMAAVRDQFAALRREAAGGMPLSLALPRLDHSLEAPLRAISPPRRADAIGPRRGARAPMLDHSLVGPPSQLLATQQHSLDHSLAAPAGWLASLRASAGSDDIHTIIGAGGPGGASASTVSPKMTATSNLVITAGDVLQLQHERGQADHTLLDYDCRPDLTDTPRHSATAAAPSPSSTAMIYAEAPLDLLVAVVDETFKLPRLRGASRFHGLVRDLRGLSPRLTGRQLVARCVEGVPVMSRPGCRWCLCWGEAVAADENGNHELGVPGARIEVIEEAAAGTRETLPRLLDDWTLADAGIETDDVLWCRYLMLPG